MGFSSEISFYRKQDIWMIYTGGHLQKFLPNKVKYVVDTLKGEAGQGKRTQCPLVELVRFLEHPHALAEEAYVASAKNRPEKFTPDNAVGCRLFGQAVVDVYQQCVDGAETVADITKNTTVRNISEDCPCSTS